MSKDNEEKVIQNEEEVKEYMEEDYEESGYKNHEFSLFDNPIEIVTVMFMVVYLVYTIWQFVNNISLSSFDMEAGLDFWISAIGKLIPAVILLVACEIYEKVQMLEYNIKLNSYYMAQYQMMLVSKLEEKKEVKQNK